MIGLTIGGYFVLVHLYFNELAIIVMKWWHILKATPYSSVLGIYDLAISWLRNGRLCRSR